MTFHSLTFAMPLRKVENLGLRPRFSTLPSGPCEAGGFQPSRGTLQMLMNDKIMFDRYYCINSAKHCENEENIDTLYFITSSHFPTQVRF